MVCGPVSDCVPQEIFEMLAEADAGFSSITVVVETPAAVAVKVTLWELFTFDETAVNPVLAAPTEIVAFAGTVIAGLLLERVTTTLVVAGASK